MINASVEHEGRSVHYRQVFVSVDTLVQEFSLPEVSRLHNCVSCGVFKKCWACPGLNGSFADYNEKSWSQVLLYSFWTSVGYDADPASSYASVQRAYQSIAPLALQYGAQLERSLGGKLMIDGRCAACRVCTAAFDPPQPCAFPEKLRSSLEALGFNVIRISKTLLDHPLEWHVDRPGYKRVPSEISVVHGVLTHRDSFDEFVLTPSLSHAATQWIKEWRENTP